MTNVSLIRVLPGIHISPETAYLVEDYPFGFKLRCRMRCWLEVDAKKGVRYCTQTTNPKRGNTVWNAVKKSTYARMAGAMYLDEKDHVHWNGLSEYSGAKEAQEFKEVYGEGVPEASKATLDKLKELLILKQKKKKILKHLFA